MAAVYGNVNVKYSPCKSCGQLHSAADYILGKRKEQVSAGIIKTETELYNAFGCNRDNFANSIIMTRKMHQKKYSRFIPRDILAQKLSISFHPDDNDRLTYPEAYKIAEQFAYEFFWKKGFEVLFAVHVDTEHVHVHFLVSNCNQKDGSSFRRGPKELVEMSAYFGEQCRERGLTHSIRDSFYSHDKMMERKTFAEAQIKKRDKLSFKDEIKLFIRLAMNDSTTKTVADVVKMLEKVYRMNIRWKGNTISYALPYRSSDNGKVRAVRGSKLGKRFTVVGIEEYMREKERRNLEYQRLEQEIEYSSPSVKDYSRWQEDEVVQEKDITQVENATQENKAALLALSEGTIPEQEQIKTEESVAPDITPYEAFDRFQEKNEIPENDETIFYGAAFDDFNEEWQGKTSEFSEASNESTNHLQTVDILDEKRDVPSPAEYRKLSLEERAELLPPLSEDNDFMEEYNKYLDRMGYTKETMQSIRYKMSVYDDFMEEYDYRLKYVKTHQTEIALEQVISASVHRRGRSR